MSCKTHGNVLMVEKSSEESKEMDYEKNSVIV